MELVMNMIIVPFLQTYAACSLLAMNVNYDLTPDKASNCVHMIIIPFLQTYAACSLLAMNVNYDLTPDMASNCVNGRMNVINHD